jgi:hypothetical protein
MAGQVGRAEVVSVHAAPETSPGGPVRPRRPGRTALISVIVVAVLAAAAAGTWAARRGGPAPAARAAAAAAGPPRAAAGPAAPGGTFTRPGGRQASLASLHGRPALVWFVAGGCASCAASIPAVAAHLAAFTRSGTQILVLGLYGAFGRGAQAPAQLASFARAAAGKAFASHAWTWGLASEQLTAAFDPSGTPDAYFLLDPAGHVTYQNSVPVSTMSALLAHLPGRAAAGP